MLHRKQSTSDTGTRSRRFPLPTGVVRTVSSITGLGWGLAVVGVIGTLVGWFTQIPEILIPGVAALTLVLVALLGSLGHSPITVDLEVATDRVQVGEEVPGRLVITNRLSRWVRGGLIRLRVDDRVSELWAPRMTPQARHEEPFIVMTSARGVITVGPALAVRGDTFGMVRRVHHQSSSVDVYVHPATTRVPAAAVGFIKDIEGLPTADLSSSDVSFRGLRDYVAGDDRRNIHWRTTARTGRLMIRQFEETRRAHLMVILDAAAQSWATAEEFELGVSVAASLARAAQTESIMVSMYSQHGRHNASTVTAALDAMTTVTTIDQAKPVVETIYRATAEAPQASVVLLVTGATTEISTLHHAMTALPSTMTVASVRCCQGAQAAVRTIGQFKILDVPELAVLGLTMHRALR